MFAFLIRRAFALASTVLVASLVVFFVLEVLPGDPALIMLGTEAQDDTLAALRSQMGLDRPAAERYLNWVAGLLAGDLGLSYAYDVPVAKMIADRLVVTLPLSVMALVISTGIAIPLGFLAAARHNRPGDWGVMIFSQLGLAIPNFWFGMLLIIVFAVQLGWFQSGGFPGWSGDPIGALKSLLLPAVALGLAEAAILTRISRSAILETLREDYVRTARAKGLSWPRVHLGHVLRNAMIPITTIVGLQLGALVAGAIVIENVFYLPGLGRLLFDAIGARDLIVIKAVVILVSAFIIFINFAVDVLYVAIDPRPRARLS